MTVSVPRHPGPWTIDDLYAIPDDGYRYEIADGSLLVSPLSAAGSKWVGERPTTFLTSWSFPRRS